MKLIPSFHVHSGRGPLGSPYEKSGPGTIDSALGSRLRAQKRFQNSGKLPEIKSQKENTELESRAWRSILCVFWKISSFFSPLGWKRKMEGGDAHSMIFLLFPFLKPFGRPYRALFCGQLFCFLLLA